MHYAYMFGRNFLKGFYIFIQRYAFNSSSISLDSNFIRDFNININFFKSLNL